LKHLPGEGVKEIPLILSFDMYPSMKILFQFLTVLTVFTFSFAPSPVRAQDAPPPPSDDQGDQSDQGASFQTFYDQLGAQGNWVQTDDYGYVFQPNVSDPDWAPYTDGHWVYTNVGWTWASDEPWGWATYHYGRWANIDGFGWVWVPGYRWAPAWVSWRYGGGYCGWAPLPPETFIGAEYGEPGFDAWATFHFGGDVDVSFNIGPGCYNFVRVGDMGESNYRGHYLDRSRNYTVINNTTNITNINISKNGAAAGNFRGVTVGGPSINTVNAHSQQRIQTVSLTSANQPGRSGLQGNSLAVYAPAVNPASVHQDKPARVAQSIAHPTFNRGDSIAKPLDVTASVKSPAPTSAAIQAAQTAQLHIPAKARIATAKTILKTPPNKPLTSLETVTPVRRTTNVATPAPNSFNGANTINPNAEHSTANAPFTGEPGKPAMTQPNEVKPAETYHPQTEIKPPTEEKPAEIYHPATEAKPTETYHPSSPPPAETYHPQTQINHEAPPPTHTETAPANHPAVTGGQGNKPAAGGNENKNAPDDKKPQGQ
jgi:hypothetical protein